MAGRTKVLLRGLVKLFPSPDNQVVKQTEITIWSEGDHSDLYHIFLHPLWNNLGYLATIRLVEKQCKQY